jgi:hypothetical protein
MARAPGREQPELFQQTLPSFRDWVIAGDHAKANRHLFEVYYPRLQRMLRGSRTFKAEAAARRFDAAAAEEWINEVLHGFLADRLARPGYLDGWARQAKRLHHYLCNGIWLYLRERFAKDHRREKLIAADEALFARSVDADAIGRELDRDHVRLLARRAREAAEQECRRRGFGDHWQVLERHLLDDLPYKMLARELGVEVDRAAVMQRTAAARFRTAFEQLVRAHVSRPELYRRAIDAFLDALDD